MIEEQANRIEEVEFRYPKKPWLFALACHLVMLGLFTIFYFGKIPEQNTGGYKGFSVAYAALVIFVLWEWPTSWMTGAKKPIVLGANGIKVAGKFASWDEIEEIKPGPWLARNTVVRIKLKKQKRPFFEFTLRPKPKALVVQAYPFVYRELIPAIRAVRPDLPVSPTIERATADPEGSVAPRRWLATVALLANIAFLTALLFPRFQNLLAQIVISSMFGLVSSNIGNFAGLLKINNRERFIEFALLCPLLVAFVVILRAFSDADPVAAKAMVIAVLTASVMGLVVLFGVKNLGFGLQIIIVGVLAGVPMGIYAYQRSQQWPARDIRGLLCGDEVGTAVWGSSGKYFTGAWYGGSGCVIDTNSLERKFVPPHDGKIRTVWPDERFLIRRIKVEDDDKNEDAMELWVYDFANNKEFQIPTSHQFGVGTQRPVDYTGRYLAWIDYEQEGQRVRFWNIETKGEDLESQKLPEDVNWVGGQAVWNTEKEIAVYVSRADEDCKDKRLYVLKINLENGQQRLLKSSREYERWYPVSDFNYAFGVNRLDDEQYSVDFVDLEKDECTPVAGKGFPLDVPEINGAYNAVVEEDGEACLRRFEYSEANDIVICEVPKRMVLLGVSGTGRYALFGYYGFPMFADYVIVDVMNNRQHRIHLPGFSGARSPELLASMPAASPFSSDERWFILETLGAGEFRTLLYEIPEKW